MKQPIRMCICCKNRYLKSTLFRFKIENLRLLDSIYGKGMYICKDCLEQDSLKLHKFFSKILKNNLDKSPLISELKERFICQKK